MCFLLRERVIILFKIHYTSLKIGWKRKSMPKVRLQALYLLRVCVRQQGKREYFYFFKGHESGDQYRMLVKNQLKITQTETTVHSKGTIHVKGLQHNCWQPVRDFWQAAGRDTGAVPTIWLWSPRRPREAHPPTMTGSSHGDSLLWPEHRLDRCRARKDFCHLQVPE